MNLSVLKKSAQACLDWILFYLSHLAPRDRYIWVFIGWRFSKEREIFAENVKYMFLHAHYSEPRVRAIWIGQDEAICKILRKEGFEAYAHSSLLGKFYSLRAYYVFVGALVQRHHWRFLGGAKIIQLWHGKSLKKTGYNSPYSLTRYNRFLSGNLFVQPYIFVAISNFFAQYVVSDFRVPHHKILCSGLPKHDPLFRSIPGASVDLDIGLDTEIQRARKEGAAFLVLYAPTFRPTGENPLETVDFLQMNTVLKRLNVHMCVTLHPKFSKKEWTPKTTLSNVSFCASEGDTYPLLKQFDLLVSDYSSLVIEFLMMRKKIVLFAPDYEEYMKTMGIYPDLWDMIPAPKVHSGTDLIQAIESHIGSKSDGLYTSVWKKMFEFSDGDSAGRIANYLLQRDT